MSRVVTVASLLLAAVLLTACGGGDGGGPTTLEVTGTDGLAFQPAELSAAPGDVAVELTAGEGTRHTFVIEDGEQTVVEAAAGQTASGTVTLEEGSYTFYCSVPGHRDAGMEGTLTVG